MKLKLFVGSRWFLVVVLFGSGRSIVEDRSKFGDEVDRIMVQASIVPKS